MSTFDQVNGDASEATGTASIFEELVGEGRKFKTPEDLAKGKKESDEFITKLQAEQAELREELSKRLTSEEVLAKIQEANNSAQAQQGENTTPLSEDKVQELVRQTLESTRTGETKSSNLARADKALVEKFGDKAGEWLVKKAGELGVSPSFLQSVAETSPNAFFNTVGLSDTNTTVKPLTTGSVNTETLSHIQGNAPKQGTKAFYDNLRKDNPKQYWSPQVQNQIMKSAKELGAAFYA